MDRLSPPPVDYEADFVLWAERQRELLSTRQFDQLDIDHLIEVLGGIVGCNKRELRHRLEVLVMHLLKCEYQPGRRSRSWLGTIAGQRADIARLIDESPGLARLIMEDAIAIYPSAVRRAALETHLDKHTFPTELPFTEQQLLDPDFFP